jgi:hypothetical protein
VRVITIEKVPSRHRSLFGEGRGDLEKIPANFQLNSMRRSESIVSHSNSAARGRQTSAVGYGGSREYAPLMRQDPHEWEEVIKNEEEE